MDAHNSRKTNAGAQGERVAKSIFTAEKTLRLTTSELIEIDCALIESRKVWIDGEYEDDKSLAYNKDRRDRIDATREKIQQALKRGYD